MGHNYKLINPEQEHPFFRHLSRPLSCNKEAWPHPSHGLAKMRLLLMRFISRLSLRMKAFQTETGPLITTNTMKIKGRANMRSNKVADRTISDGQL